MNSLISQFSSSSQIEYSDSTVHNQQTQLIRNLHPPFKEPCSFINLYFKFFAPFKLRTPHFKADQNNYGKRVGVTMQLKVKNCASPFQFCIGTRPYWKTQRSQQVIISN